jgi:hypothetical protein
MTPILSCISKYVDQFYNYKIDQDLAFRTLRDSLSSGQVASKMKIIEACKKNDLKSELAVFVGHWHGLLPLMMKNENIISQAIGVEKSELWSDFSNYLNREWNWKSYHQDIQEYIYPIHTDLVVNTSCEHMTDEWLAGVPKGCRVLLQSTNYEHPEHMNRKESLSDFKKSLSDLDIQFEDSLDCDVYLRFTVFGIKK